MESETAMIDLQPSTRDRVLAAVGPLICVAISYVDPGKWAAALEGGAQFGFDLILLVLVVNFIAILCHYLSARIAIATGRNLAQICRKEYDDMACTLLGIQTEISMIMLDLTMVLGTAYGLNAVFGINLFNCVFLTGFDVIVFPIFTGLLGNPKANIICICLACFILASCVSGVLMNLPEPSLSVGGILSDLTGENAYALMGILGAHMMPHNFYLHSSIVQQQQGQSSVSKGALFHDQFFAIFCVFSGVFLVNCMLINLAANVFYSSGLTSLTLQDAVSLLDQGFRSSLTSTALLFIMLFSNQLVAATWGLDKQVIANDFFGLDIPGWLHCVTIRIVAIIPALSCIWYSGSEGIFQFLIFAQVTVALLLPSSLIPLFRVASSRSIMGAYKVSQLVEFLALLSFIGILGLNIIFIVELIFGSSDWVTSLTWNIGIGMPVSYIILLIAAFASLSLMLWLATTPLKSASSGVDAHALKCDKQGVVTELGVDGDKSEAKEAQYQLESEEKQEPVSSLDKSFGTQQNLSCASSELNLPETLLVSEKNLHLIRTSDDKYDTAFSKPAADNNQAFATFSEAVLPESTEVKKNELQDQSSLSAESSNVVEKTLKIEGDIKIGKDDKGDPWGPEEWGKDVSEMSQSLMSEGPGSFRSLSGKLDDMGSGTGSLSRLGRAARRQLTSILDEFWGQLFDFHGQVMPEAKAKRLDVLLGVDSKVDQKSSFGPVKLENISKEPTRFFPSSGTRVPDPRASIFYGPSMQHVGQSNVGLSLGVQPGSPGWSNHARLWDSYMRDSGHSALESGERRYHSVHAPVPTEAHDKQPVTIHGFSMASYLNRVATEQGADYLKSQLGSLTQSSTSSIKSNNIDLYSRPLGQKPQNGLRAPPGFHNVPAYRNSSLKFERPVHELSSPEPMDYSNNPPDEKKFRSLPNISGLYMPHQNLSPTGNGSRWEYSGFRGQPISRLGPDQTTLSAYPRSTAAVGFSPNSPTKVCRDAFSLQCGSNSGTGSLWSKQPYEQFGVADKSSSGNPETPSFMDMEAKLLQSFRSSIMKLLKLEGSTWLFRQNDGADEDLIDRVAAREKFLYDIETMTADRNLGSTMKNDEIDHSKFMSVPNCGDGCVWRVDLIVSFGVWCIHRVLELSLMESRPELWGKYTYVLNRLQGIIDLAFSKNRSPTAPCFCLQLDVGYQQKVSWPVTNSSLPPQSKVGRGKVTTAPMLLEIIKDVELAISCRKGRSGTAAGDVAFPKGKENLASVLKRYKRRLANKPIGGQEAGLGARKNALSPPQGL